MNATLRRWARVPGGVMTRIEDAVYSVLRKHEQRPQTAESEQPVPETTQTPAPITVKASITDGIKHVVVYIEDAAQVAALVAKTTGHDALAAGITGVAGLAETALAGYENAAFVTITPESITGLLADPTPLAPATDPNANQNSGTTE